MNVKIGDRDYPTRRPDDLDEQLVQSTGCNAKETAGLLSGGPLAITVARALHPFLTGDDQPSIPELASAIAAAGAVDVSRDVVALYVPAEAGTGLPALSSMDKPALIRQAGVESVEIETDDNKPDIIRKIEAKRKAS